MKKTVLITGSTDGIGLATAKTFLQLGHKVLLHGRSEAKLTAAKQALSAIGDTADIETYKADLSVLSQVASLAVDIAKQHSSLDVLINNAGVYMVPNTLSEDGLDVRFMVNTIAPYLLTTKLMPLLNEKSRVVNLSSAAQTSVNASELLTQSVLSDGAVYGKSKLALTMWSRQLASTLGDKGPVIVAVNPKSFLGSKMVKDAYGVAGGDLQQGADILVSAGLSDEFANASGLYFDNDTGQFTQPHGDAVNPQKIAQMTQVIEEVIAKHSV